MVLSRNLSIRRILVAIDGSPQSLAAVGAAVELGRKLEAELHGLFVEDVDLLQLAASPFAREFLLPTAKETPLNRAGMERKLKAQAEQAQKALSIAAEKAKISWTFRVVRGSVASEVLAAAAGCDLLALGWRGWSLARKPRIGSTASAAVSKAMPALLLSEWGRISDLPVVVCYDGRASARAAVLAAAELAQIGSRDLRVILLSEPSAGESFRREITNLLAEKTIQPRLKYASPDDQAKLYQAIRSELPALLVLPDGKPSVPLELVNKLADEVNFSVLFLGGAPTS